MRRGLKDQQEMHKTMLTSLNFAVYLDELALLKPTVGITWQIYLKIGRIVVRFALAMLVQGISS